MKEHSIFIFTVSFFFHKFRFYRSKLKELSTLTFSSKTLENVIPFFSSINSLKKLALKVIIFPPVLSQLNKRICLKRFGEVLSWIKTLVISDWALLLYY